jgi:HD-GYP domain-containing protein (c-di-GMP phosphodiesterase class II)
VEHREDRLRAEPAGPSASQQLADVLLQVITEQNVLLAGHLKRVSELAGALAEVLGLPEPEIRRIWLAGRLHDVGMMMFQKLEPFDASNWALMRLAPLIGERIVSAAPALASTAPLIRSSHEQVDGEGYPDQLVGGDIPLGSRIIAVCDAFAAMTSPYGPRRGVAAALEELERWLRHPVRRDYRQGILRGDLITRSGRRARGPRFVDIGEGSGSPQRRSGWRKCSGPMS